MNRLHLRRRIGRPATHRNLYSDYPKFGYFDSIAPATAAEDALKAQYIGDINDYRKYALLRALQRRSGVKVGVCWMMTPDDRGQDGQKKAFVANPSRWRHYDPELFDALSGIAHRPTTISEVERLEAFAGFSFWNAEVPDALTGRLMYMGQARQVLAGADLVFFDPDNGLDVASRPKGRKNSSKYVFRDELADFYLKGKSVLFYQHYPRVERRTYEHAIGAELHTLCPDSIAYCFSTGHVAFFLAAHKHHFALLMAAAELAASQHPDMLTGKRLSDLEVLTDLVERQSDEA